MKTCWSLPVSAAAVIMMMGGPRGLRGAPGDPVYESSQVMEVHATGNRTLLSGNSAALANCTLFGAAVRSEANFSSGGPMRLYRTDGTTSGTFLPGAMEVRSEIKPGGGTGWFVGRTGGNFSEESLFRSDGTEAGTVAVVSLTQANFYRVGELKVSGGTVFLLYEEDWRLGSNSKSGLFTHKIATGTSNFQELPVKGVTSFEVDGDAIYLGARAAHPDGFIYRAAWDGSSVGAPILLAPYWPGAFTDGWMFYLIRENISGAGDKWTIKKTRGTKDREITEAGVVFARSLDANSSLSIVTTANGRIYCNVKGETTYPDSTGLWVSDGTAAGTRRLVAQPAQSLAHVEGGRIAMTCAEKSYDELNDFWVTDGDGVRLVKAQMPRAMVMPVTGGAALQELDYSLDVDKLAGVWTSDLKPGSVTKVATIPGFGGGSDRNFISLHNGAAVFMVNTTETGHEPWILNSIQDRPRLLKNIGSDGAPVATLYGEAGGRLLYYAWTDEGLGHSRLYSFGGSGSPVTLVDPLYGGDNFKSVTTNGHCFFSVWRGSSTSDLLFRSDGTVAGTSTLDAPVVSELRAAGNRVYITGSTLRMTDTTATTNFPTSLNISCAPVGQRQNGSTAYVSAGGKLWQAREDGGVFEVGAQSTTAGDVAIYRSGETDGTDYEPWRTDGTAAGTYRLVDANPGTASSEMSEVVKVGTEWWFVTYANTTLATKLWRTDGTAAGTQLLTDLPSGVFPADPLYGGAVTGAGGRIFFQSVGGKFWSSDGTAAGTRELGPGQRGQVAWQGRIFYNGFSEATGNELWTSDGTAAGTYPVEDLIPGPEGANPSALTVAGDRLYYKTSVPQGDTGLTMAQVRMVNSVPGTTLAAWAAEAGLTGGGAEPQANPAGDGVPNLLKYAFNLNPVKVDRREWRPGGTAGLPRVAAASVKGMDTVDITFLKRIGGGLKYTVERSGSGLEGWEPVPGTARDTVVAPGWESCTVSVARGAASRFFRVAVTLSGG